jgi:endonuclease YncB( thermonuclease family)
MSKFRRRRSRSIGPASDLFVLGTLAAAVIAAFEVDPEGALSKLKVALIEPKAVVTVLNTSREVPAPDSEKPRVLEKDEDRVEARVREPLPPGTRIDLLPPYEVLDAKTFSSGEWTVSLDGVEGPLREAVCYAKDGLLFGCGLRARAALNNAIRRRPVTCELRQDHGPNKASADCQIDGKDLALDLIEGGWLRPRNPASTEREQARTRAEAAGAGLWDGGWRIR